MRSALLAATLLLATPAFALFGTMNVEVRDARDRPAAEGFVFAREIGYIGKIHGSTRVCMRAGAATVTGGTAKVDWPMPAMQTIAAGLRRIEVVAYLPGHCATQATDWTSAVAMRPAAAPQAVDERLLYLQEVTASLYCDEGSWGGGSVAAIERLAKALDEEMRPLAREPYELYLAERIRANLRLARARIARDGPGVSTAAAPGFSRDFVVVPGNSPLEPVVLRCRHGEPSACNLNQRDSHGETALGAAINGLRPDEVRVLLAAGADPAMLTTPAGEPAIDVLLRRMGTVSPSHSNSDRALEILALLATHPKVAISRQLKQDLATDPSRWMVVVNHTMGGPLYVRARETLAALPQRPDRIYQCARPNAMGFDTALRPFALR